MASYAPASTGALERGDVHEPHTRKRREPAPAVDDEARVDLGADGERRRRAARLEEAEEGAVPASVVEHAAAGEGARERERRTEAAAVAPGDERIAAVDLLPGVMAGFDRISNVSHRVSSVAVSGGRSPPIRTPAPDRRTPSRGSTRGTRTSRPDRACARAASGLAAIARNASAIACASRAASTRRTLRSWTAMPPTAVATTGVPQASASSGE